MLCPYCGKEVQENAVFCIYCGKPLSAPSPYPQQPAPPYQPNAPMYPQPEYYLPMKWYKFLIYFSLFAGAVLNALTGISYLTGSVYATLGHGYVDAAAVYDFYGETLQMLDLVFGVALIALAAFGIYTRFQLAGFKRNAPLFLYTLYAASTLLPLIYNIAVFLLFGIDVDFASEIGSLVGVAINIWLNFIYFRKRAHMFIY